MPPVIDLYGVTYCSTSVAAELLDCSVNAVRVWACKYRVPHIRRGRTAYYALEAVQARSQSRPAR